MNNINNCQERRESIVALVLGELDERAAGLLREHIGGCRICRGVRDALVEEEQGIRSAFESMAQGAKAGEMGAAHDWNCPRQLGASAAWPVQFLKGASTMIFAHKRMSAVAAVLVAVAGILVFSLLSSSGSVAYALEQTTQANSGVRYYHVKITPPGEGIAEAWAELDAEGNVVHLRVDFPKTEDGAKVSILSPDKAEVWFKDKNSFLIVNDKSVMKKMFDQLRGIFDPKLVFDELEKLKASGKVQVATQEPARKGEPVTVTVTSAATPDRKEVYLVNADTKLVEQHIKYYQRMDQTWEVVARFEYLDYNKPIDAKIWHPDLPKDVMRVDQTIGKIGVAKGDLKDNEIAQKVAREFFEALIAKDYTKAGEIMEGVPGDYIKKNYGDVKYVRIVEIGDPTPYPIKETGFLVVPVTAEIERDGTKSIQKFTLHSRAAYNQPDRWTADDFNPVAPAATQAATQGAGGGK